MTRNLPLAPVHRNISVHDLPHVLPLRHRAVPTLETRATGREADLAEAAYTEGFAQGRHAAAGELESFKASLVAEHDERCRAGFEQGHADGVAQGRADADGQLRQLGEQLRADAEGALAQKVEALDALARSLRAAWQQAMADAEDDLVALAHEALCRMLGRAAADPAMLEACVRQLLAAHTDETNVRLHVHPADFRALEGGATGVHWIPDDDVALGGVLLRIERMTLDARLEVQMAALRRVLLQVRAGSGT